MQWLALIAIVAIVMFSIVQGISMATGRPLPGGTDSEDVKKLKKRIEELEAAQTPPEIEDRIPTKSEVNLAAEDRWRLEMLEARLEELEKNRDKKDDDGSETDTASS